MSGKPTEEGWFWEWRTFGEPPKKTIEIVEGHDVRGKAGEVSDDVYLISTLTTQNVKLREDGSLLKLKPLLAALEDGCELYEETARLVFDMPAGDDAVLRAASLLGTRVELGSRVHASALLAAFDAQSDVVTTVHTHKVRTQYVAGDGWLELADVTFPGGRVRSLGIQSKHLDETRRLRALVDPDRRLDAMNYVEACRRWGR